MAKIVVVGSFNMDLVVRMPAIPRPGETLLGGVFATFPGGKGANQAVAAARLGGEVTMVGQVGTDAFGDQLLAWPKRKELIPASWASIPSGHWRRLDQGRRPGAKQHRRRLGSQLHPDRRRRCRSFCGDQRVDLVVMPLETPMDTIVAGAELAHKAGRAWY